MNRWVHNQDDIKGKNKNTLTINIICIQNSLPPIGNDLDPHTLLIIVRETSSRDIYWKFLCKWKDFYLQKDRFLDEHRNCRGGGVTMDVFPRWSKSGVQMMVTALKTSSCLTLFFWPIVKGGGPPYWVLLFCDKNPL